MTTNFGKYYTRLVAIFFVLIIFSLVSDYTRFGFRPETMHKAFHILLGLIVLKWGWNSEAWWRIFPLVNGAFFSFVALFGILFPDFGALDAFNTVDTLLHLMVGLFGLTIGIIFLRKRH